MPIIQRTLGYTPGVQQLVWPSGTNVPVTAYLWGGGGGGGGFDAQPGGAGTGGGFTEVSFSVSAGDVIDVAVGGGGAGGPNARTGGVGGVAGASYVSNVLFDTRTAATSPPVVPSTNSAYVSFLNTHGVWASPVTAANFDRSYVVNFPTTGNYTFTASADNSAKIYVDDTFIGDVPGFTATYTLTVSVFAGNHTIRIEAVNTGGPGSVALTIDGGVSYSGGNGGPPGPSGTSGGGGGGGGATVIFKNDIPLAVAGGGGGGGGGGRNSGGASAPGDRGQAAEGVFAGQDGQRRTTDGGGGGAGGGGLGGGNGGFIVGGDSGATAGAFGLSSSPSQNPNGRTPGGFSNAYYAGSAAAGGAASSNGSAGMAVLLFDTPGSFVHTDISFVPVRQTWVKFNEVWQPTQAVYIKQDGSWTPTLDSFAPNFTSTGTDFGVASRPIDPEPMPPNPGPPPDTGGSWESWSPDGPVSSYSSGKDGSAINTMGDISNTALA
jgi:hypothetical protein